MENGSGSQAAIPISHYKAAAKDADLKLLLRQQDTAERRVVRAQEKAKEAADAIAAYIAKTYPAEPAAVSA